MVWWFLFVYVYFCSWCFFYFVLLMIFKLCYRLDGQKFFLRSFIMSSKYLYNAYEGDVAVECPCGRTLFVAPQPSVRSLLAAVRDRGWFVRSYEHFYVAFCPDCKKFFETRGRKKKVVCSSVSSDSGDGAV